MTAASATVRDLGHTIVVEFLEEAAWGNYVKRQVMFSPDIAVAVYEALHEWVSGDWLLGDKEEK